MVSLRIICRNPRNYLTWFKHGVNTAMYTRLMTKLNVCNNNNIVYLFKHIMMEYTRYFVGREKESKNCVIWTILYCSHVTVSRWKATTIHSAFPAKCVAVLQFWWEFCYQPHTSEAHVEPWYSLNHHPIGAQCWAPLELDMIFPY